MAAVFFLQLLASVSSDCVFTQNCTVPPYICNPPHKIDPIPPFKAAWTGPIACPMFLGQEVCCTNDQNAAMFYKFFLLDNTFGHLAGGCDICSANMKLMWCYFTCSPNQSNFVSAGAQTVVPSPVDNTPITIMLNNFTVTNGLSCEIYESCQKCPYVTEVSAMQSPQGFLEFQGYEGIPIGLLWTTFYFDDGPAALDLSFLPCTQNVTNAYGYPTVPCSCNNCEGKCASNYYVAEPATLHGLNWPLVGFFYLGLMIISIVVLFIQFKLKQRNRANERIESRRDIEIEDSIDG